MATSGAVIQVLVGAGYKPRTAKDLCAQLRNAGEAPFGEGGRGQHKGHYEADHLAAVHLALFGHAPSDAAATVAAAGAMTYSVTGPEGVKSPIAVRPGLTLRQVVTEGIIEAARFAQRKQGHALVPSWVSVQLSIGQHAIVRWGNGAEDLFVPAGNYASSNSISRTTTIMAPLMLELGKLLADTWRKQSGGADAAPPGGLASGRTPTRNPSRNDLEAKVPKQKTPREGATNTLSSALRDARSRIHEIGNLPVPDHMDADAEAQAFAQIGRLLPPHGDHRDNHTERP